MKITKDINIGPYKWTKWIDFNQNEVAYEIDAEFKPEQIIKLFKLDQGFENNEVSNNSINGKGITKIALIIIAVYLIVANIGGFISQVIFSFKASVSRNSLDVLLGAFNPNPVDYQEMISTAISLVVGFLLLTNHTRFSNWIEKINNKNVVE